MNKYQVKYFIANYQGLDPTVTVDIEASNYDTTATNGAGLVADFYDNVTNNKPDNTLSHVLEVKKLPPDNTTRIDFTDAEARIVLSNLRAQFENEFPVGIARVLDILADATRGGSGGVGHIPWMPWPEGVSQAPATSLVTRELLIKLRKISDINGRPIWEPAAVTGAPDFICGEPVVTNS